MTARPSEAASGAIAAGPYRPQNPVRFVTAAAEEEEQVLADSGTEQAWSEAVQSRYASLAPGAFPNVAAMAAELGDDVFEDDPTIVRLEQRGAELVGQEAGLFMASGTMGNQVAIMTHTRRGNEVLVGVREDVPHVE